MRIVFWLALALAFSAAGGARAAGTGCPDGTYSVVISPDGTSLSILFDAFIAQAGGSGPNADRKDCSLSIPLNLPAGQSLGVYKIDYRGFAQVAQRQSVDLKVAYGLGPNNNRTFSRRIRNQSDDYLFTETLPAGLMKRVGCGAAAVLNVQISLDLQTNGTRTDALATLDTADGGGPALVYQFNFKPC